MAEPLKNSFGDRIPRRIAAAITAVHPQFDGRAFLREALLEYDALSLTARAERIARALRRYLPADYPRAIAVLLASLGPKLPPEDGVKGMAPFLYLPHVIFVRLFGLEHFEESMRAQHELTQRFTAEFSIRAFLEKYPQETLARLRAWARDPSADVRRLVSEGTRPRLPWAPRLRAFQADPRPVLELLELLKDDPALYVRRSVANNLNDISKDHPALACETARRWLQDATPQRRWIVRHALRSAIKRGDPRALTLLGFGRRASVTISKRSVAPKRVRIGGEVTIELTITSAAARTQRLMADLRVHYVKASGKARAKVFKLKALELAPRSAVTLRKKLSLANLTTRTHYPGLHRVDVLLNGQAHPIGSFELSRATTRPIRGIATSL